MCNRILCMHDVVGEQKPLENLSTKQTLLKKQEQQNTQRHDKHDSEVDICWRAVYVVRVQK